MYIALSGKKEQKGLLKVYVRNNRDFSDTRSPVNHTKLVLVVYSLRPNAKWTGPAGVVAPGRKPGRGRLPLLSPAQGWPPTKLKELVVSTNTMQKFNEVAWKVLVEERRNMLVITAVAAAICRRC